MSETNPYQTPGSEVVEPAQGGQLGEPQSHGAGNGWTWIADGFGIFKQGIGLWIGMIIVYMLIMIVLSFIPLVNFLLGIIAPVFTGGFMVVCQRADREGGFEFGDMFAGFKNQTGPLFILGLIYLGFMIVIMLVMFALMFVFGAGGAMMGDPQAMGALGAGIMIVVLLSLALFIPLAMAMWFAPALIILNNISPWEAFKMSFRGCLKNIIPFLIYGVILFVLGIVAAIPFGLGFLVLGPVIIASIYTGYKDIFIQG